VDDHDGPGGEVAAAHGRSAFGFAFRHELACGQVAKWETPSRSIGAGFPLLVAITHRIRAPQLRHFEGRSPGCDTAQVGSVNGWSWPEWSSDSHE
jgi:hypothetical protein